MLFLDDIQVVDEIMFTFTGDKECTLDWQEHDLKIDFPKGSLSSGHTVKLQVKAVIAGNFILPPGCLLVSSIYWINCPERFDKKVTLHLPHAAVIESEEEASFYRFYAAKCFSGPPYVFRELKNGSFAPYKKSASIALSQFSHIAMGTSELPSSPIQRYYSKVFYKIIQPHEWDMFFIVMKDVPAFRKVYYLLIQMVYVLHLLVYFLYIQFIKEEYSDCSHGTDQIIKLKEDARFIKLQPDNDCSDFWEMTELISSQVYITFINVEKMFSFCYSVD